MMQDEFTVNIDLLEKRMIELYGSLREGKKRLAVEAKTSPSTIGRILRDGHIPCDAVRFLIASTIKVDENDVFRPGKGKGAA